MVALPGGNAVVFAGDDKGVICVNAGNIAGSVSVGIGTCCGVTWCFVFACCTLFVRSTQQFNRGYLMYCYVLWLLSDGIFELTHGF